MSTIHPISAGKFFDYRVVALTSVSEKEDILSDTENLQPTYGVGGIGLCVANGVNYTASVAMQGVTRAQLGAYALLLSLRQIPSGACTRIITGHAEALINSSATEERDADISGSIEDEIQRIGRKNITFSQPHRNTQAVVAKSIALALSLARQNITGIIAYTDCFTDVAPLTAVIDRGIRHFQARVFAGPGNRKMIKKAVGPICQALNVDACKHIKPVVWGAHHVSSMVDQMVGGRFIPCLTRGDFLDLMRAGALEEHQRK